MTTGAPDPTRRGVVAGAASAPLLAGQATAGADLISIRTDLETWVAMGDKASGGPGDRDSGAWMESRLRLFGYRTQRQAFRAPSDRLGSVALTLGNASVQGLAQAPASVTGPGGVTGGLTLGRPTAPARGALVVVDLPARRWSSVRQPELRTLADEVRASGAAGLILVTNGPTGEAIALNAPAGAPPFGVPTLVLAPKDAGPVLAAAREGQTARLVIDGKAGQRTAFNLIGRIDRGAGRTVVLSTPRSGWFTCAGERGPGIALWMALLPWMAKTLTRHDIVVVTASGHEYENLGAEAFLHREAPAPERTALWVHLGAGIAARDWAEPPQGLEPLDRPDPARVLMGSPHLVDILKESFAGEAGLEAPLPAGPTAAGELAEILKAGYPAAFGVFGAHRFHHTILDDARCLDPAFVERLLPRFQAAMLKALGEA
ncbi:hypothetical protein [Phenylobacterium sp.]|uniref:hypothetical protein n=1 Tax=Phenylobacterium sp. TaxID=1871053 RepID=UPI002FDE16DC